MSEKKADISELREHLFATLRGLKDGTVQLDQARAINEISKTLIDSARVEVDYLKVAGEIDSTFFAGEDGEKALPDGITGRTVHRIRG